MRTKKPFIIYVKNKNLPRKVFYVKYTDSGIVLSTGETSLIKAEKFAVEHLEDHTKEGLLKSKQADEFHKLLLEYYEPESEHIEYCNQHNRKVSEKGRKSYVTMMKRICKLTPDVRKFKQLDKQRLIKLQKDLLDLGITVKTVKNNFTALERIYKELLDKDVIDHNPFLDLPPLKNEIKQAWDGFPIRPYKNNLPLLPITLSNENDLVYSLVCYVAIMTGQREGEIELLDDTSIIKTKEKKSIQYWLNVNGTKTHNANRVIPITKMTALAIKCLCELKKHNTMKNLRASDYNVDCLLYYGKICGYDTLEKLKNTNDGKSKIVFHGFRKMYKTFLTQENVNKDLIEFCLGHKSKMVILRNSHSNLNDTYLILEKADNRNYHKIITTTLSNYFEPVGYEKEKVEMFLYLFGMAAENGLTITNCFNFATEKANSEMIEIYKEQYGDAYWGGVRLTEEQKEWGRNLLKELNS